jgi:hypothetical protein
MGRTSGLRCRVNQAQDWETWHRNGERDRETSGVRCQGHYATDRGTRGLRCGHMGRQIGTHGAVIKRQMRERQAGEPRSSGQRIGNISPRSHLPSDYAPVVARRTGEPRTTRWRSPTRHVGARSRWARHVALLAALRRDATRGHTVAHGESATMADKCSV